MRQVLVLVFVSCAVTAMNGVEQSATPGTRITQGAKVFIAAMDGFDTYLISAFSTKKVPLVVVSDRQQAEFEIVGVSDSQKPGWARTLVRGDTGTDEQASIVVKNIQEIDGVTRTLTCPVVRL